MMFMGDFEGVNKRQVAGVTVGRLWEYALGGRLALL